MKTDNRYIHRLNEDGTIDSICLRCFRTAATARAIESLAEPQLRHQCNNEHLFDFFQYERRQTEQHDAKS
jgi:hypothetical protein